MALDSPPPNPVNSPMPGMGALMPEMGATPTGGENVDGLIMLGSEIDKSLMSLASAGLEGSREFNQARDLIKAGLAKVLQVRATGSPSMQTSGGARFPGSTMGSVGIS